MENCCHKSEHQHEKTSQDKTAPINKSQAILLGLGLLFLIGALQTLFLSNALAQVSSLKETTSQTATALSQTGTATQTASAPASSPFASLPTQVGGC